MTSPDQQKAKLLAAVRAEPSPARDAVRRQDLSRLVGAALVAALLLLATGGVRATVRPHPLVATSASLWGALAVLVSGLALRRGRSMLGVPRAWLVGMALAIVPALAAAWFWLPWADLTRSVPHPLGTDSVCLVLTLAFAAAPLVAFVGMRREGDPVRPAVTGAALGAGAGAWGATLIDLHCEMLDPRHVVLGHLLPVLVLVVAGALWGRTALAVRAAPR